MGKVPYLPHSLDKSDRLWDKILHQWICLSCPWREITPSALQWRIPRLVTGLSYLCPKPGTTERWTVFMVSCVHPQFPPTWWLSASHVILVVCSLALTLWRHTECCFIHRIDSGLFLRPVLTFYGGKTKVKVNWVCLIEVVLEVFHSSVF